MNVAIKVDLLDIQDALEHLAKSMAKMKLEVKIDVAARLRAVIKTASQLDEAIKDEIKGALNHEAGDVPGEIFKAHLAFIPTTRLDQKALEAELPKIYAKYLRTKDQERVTFEAR